MPAEIPQNPDVRPAKIRQRSGIRTVLVLVGGAVVERLTAYLTGIEAPWAPYAAAVLTALWAVYRGPPSYRQDDPEAPDVVIRR